MLKPIQKMPKCRNKECVNGLITESFKTGTVQKICKFCEELEKDLIDSEDYEVYVQNGRVIGFNLIEDYGNRNIPTLNDTLTE